MNMLASRGQLRASFLRWALFTVPLCVLLGFLSGQLGSPDTAWFQSLVKPGIYPEPKWFGIVWTILYVMIGFALALVASRRLTGRVWPPQLGQGDVRVRQAGGHRARRRGRPGAPRTQPSEALSTA